MKKRICGIYKITNNINGKCYIGKSECNVYNRLEEHKKKTHNEHLKKAFEKYGIDNFSFEVITLCSRELCGELEKYYIQKYNSNNPIFGYNKTSGDERHGTVFSDEVIEVLREKSTGRKDSDETKNKKREGRIGKKHSETSKKQMSESHTGKKATDKTRKKLSKSHKDFYASLTPEERRDKQAHSTDTVWMTNGIERKQVSKQDIEKYLLAGYVMGMKIENKPLKHKTKRTDKMTNEELKESYGHEKGKVFVHNGEIIKKIAKDEIGTYLLNGFKLGMGKKK